MHGEKISIAIIARGPKRTQEDHEDGANLHNSGSDFDAEDINRLSHQRRDPTTAELNRDAEHEQAGGRSNQSWPDGLQAHLRPPFLALLQGALGDEINGWPGIRFTDQRSDQAREGRQADVQDGELIWRRLENQGDLGRDANVHHVRDAEPERSEHDGRELEHDEGPRGDEEEFVLLDRRALGDVDAVPRPERGLLGIRAEAGRARVADVDGLGDEDDLCEESDADEDQG